MKDNKPDIILLIFKIIMTSVMMIFLSLIEPAFVYIWGAAVLMTAVICLTFAFIGREENKQ